MAESVENTYVSVNICGGLDWHDIKTWSNFLQENGKFELTDAIKAIAKHVYKELKNMYISSSDSENKTVLENIPSLEEVTECIRNRKTFSVTSEDGLELEASWNPEENQLTQGFCSGQVSYYITYDILEIAPENVIYIASENFLCPMKGVPSVGRFYKAPFISLEDAQKECERIQAAIKERNDKNVQPELVIADKTVISETDWYKYNMQVIDLLAEHPELDNADNFKLQVQYHLEKLKEKIAA